MFSVVPTTPITRNPGGLRIDSARIRPSTAPAPHMSYFISSILSAGLIEMPPESKVRPLPTIASVCLGRGARYSISIRKGSCAEPWLTARIAVIFRRRSAALP
jgi:hypothetical protein